MTLRIPTLLFMGSPQQSYITQSFTLSKNGTFSVSDDYHNSFSFRVPVSVTGSSALTSIVGNSTMAVMETKVITGLTTNADLKLSFSTYRQFCQPAGIRLEISGMENWGASGQGTLEIEFGQKPLASSAYRAWFSNSSGVALGLDWNDSWTMVPHFNATTRSLAWTVGSSFDIDPYTVTSLAGSADLNSDLRNTFYAAGRYWVFFDDPPSFKCASSSDGIHWTTITIGTTPNWGQYPPAAITFDGRYVYYAFIYTSNGINSNLQFGRGTPNADGSITWSAPQQTVGTGSYANPSGPVEIAVDTGGHAWITFEDASSALVVMNSATDGTWATSSGFPYANLYPQAMGVFQNCLPESLTNQKMAIFCGGGGNIQLTANLYNSGWQTQQTYSSYALGRNNMGVQAVTIGDTVFLLGQGYGSSALLWFSYSGATNSFSGTTNPFSTQSCIWCPPSLSVDPSGGRIYAYWSPTTTGNQIETSTFSGTTWSAPSVLLSLPSAMVYPWNFEISYALSGGLVMMMFQTGSAAPYQLYFAAVPMVIPTAALSSNSWSRPGLSPYESYFSETTDYLSPGNGLVAFEAGTFVLAGRAIDFAPSLVYSEPYAFRSSGSPYLYDNYTGASVGYGWSLNFPWLGTNYIHLTDGQSFPYVWNGNTFQYNGVTNFVLTKNTGGTYTLNMSSGTLYRFDTSKRLVSITDRTGNNRISFTYGSNNYVSRVTDTIGRNTTFSYNANNQLTGISTGRRTWTIGYSGNQLTSLADPISSDPPTTFQYAGTSGANSWLLSAVIWPTNGKVAYTYTSKPVGTEVSTNYATLRNVYFDSTHLSLSQSINYTTFNGQVTWSNSTIYDGTTYRGYVNYNFQPTKNLMKTYSYDGTKTLQRITETDSDTSGRTNETKIVSPAGAVLTNSTYSYDNWGNMIHSKDNVGQPSWFSYANTNSNKSFGSSGCTKSFYSQTISPNIHDLIVGSCDYQNGPGYPQQQTYYRYDANGNLLETKVSHNGGWLTTDYTYDSYGNVLTLTNANGYTTYFRYSSAYNSAYLTKESTLVSGPPSNLAIDGSTTKKCTSAASCQTSTGITTTHPNDVVIAVCLTSSTVTWNIPTDTSHLTWTSRGSVTGTGTQQEWYAVSTSALSGDKITCSFSGTATTIEVLAFAVSGASPSSPFDPNLLAAVTNSCTGTACKSGGSTGPNPQVTLTTTNANDFVYSTFGQTGSASETCQSSFSTLFSSCAPLSTPNAGGQYKVVSTTQSSLVQTITSGCSTNCAWNIIGDAIQANAIRNVTTTYIYNSTTGFRLSETDPEGNTTSYMYDALGRVTQVTYPTVGGVTAYSHTYYYGNNNTMKTIDQIGHVTKTYFDGLARETEVQRWNGTSAYSAEYFTYNWLDQVATKTTAAGYTYTYYFDWDGQLTKTTNPDHTNSTTSYDYVNNQKTVTDENGHKTVYAYDWNQRLGSVKQYNSSANYFLTTYLYDLAGNTLSVTDAKHNQTAYQYDDLNRLTTTTFPTSPATTESRTYDNMGNMLTLTPANGTNSKILYIYDQLNRLTKVTYPGSGGAVTYTYDAAGNRLSMASPSASDYYRYDARDRVINATEYVGGVKYQALYSYDKASNIVQVTYPDSYALSMTYDGANRLKTVGSYATIGYTVDDKVSKITYGNGEVTTYTYYSTDRPKEILDKYGSTKEMDLNYTYDGTGNVLTLNNEAYHYDWLNRLNYTSGPWTTTKYAYDQVGNRIRMVQGSTTTVYCYGAYNSLASYTTSTCSSPTVSYTYDSNGNLITKTGGWTYSYDYANELTKVTHSGSTVQTNAYDGDGNRVKQVAGSSTNTYSYQGLNILYEKNVTGTHTTLTKHFYANGLQLAKMVNSTKYYLHEDALGSVRLVATATVTIKFSSNYVPYGSNYAMVGKEVFMYTGKMYDSATGLYYYGARYYDSTIGRFVTEDSYSGSMADPMTLNRYIYARDNPERYTDPNGHMFVVETDSGQEIGGDYPYKPAVVETVTVADTERKRSEYFVTDTPAMSTYQNTAFSGHNPYGGGLNNAFFAYQKTAFGLQNLYGTPTVTPTTSGSGILGALLVLGGAIASTGAAFWGGLQITAQIAKNDAAEVVQGAIPDVSAAMDILGPVVIAAAPAYATGYVIGYMIECSLGRAQFSEQGAGDAFIKGLNDIANFLQNGPWGG